MNLLSSLSIFLVSISYIAVIGTVLWVILRGVRALEQMGRAIEDIAGSLRQDRS